MAKKKQEEFPYIEPSLWHLAVPIASLKEDPAQVNEHDDRSISAIARSLGRHGQKKNIVAKKDGTVKAGWGTVLAAAKSLGWTHLAVVLSDEDDHGLDEYALEDNRTAQFSKFNAERLLEQLSHLGELGVPPTELGWNEEEFDALRKEVGGGDDGGGNVKDTEPQVDRADELMKEWGTETGQLWALGNHRLLCGDSTKRDDVVRVLDGQRVQLCMTDPPYGVGVVYDGFGDTKDAVRRLAQQWFPLAQEFCDVLVFTPGVTQQRFYPEPTWSLCWFYGGGIWRSPWGFNSWQPILAYGDDPSLATGNGCRPDGINLNTPANAADIAHPCPKPLPLWEWLLDRVSFDENDIIFDPFSGSGTTIITCDKKGRRCRAIEMSPAYVAVTLQRYLDATGMRPVLLSEGANT